MRRIATYLNTLSEYKVPISILAVITILSNVVVALVFTGYYYSHQNANTPLISTRQVSINGREYEILTNAQGLTLYYFYLLGSDTPNKNACTGGCTTTWHPLLLNDTSAFMAVNPELRGQLTAVSGPDGLQVQHNGHFLYTYSGDKMPGQMNGNGHSVDTGAITETAVYSSIPPANQSTESAYIPLISTSQTFIHGLGYEILTNAQELTLYYPTYDDVCTGECTTTWHPLLITDPSALMTVSPALRDRLAAVPGPNGLQVQYVGHFLYTYSGDTGPSQMNGSTDGRWTIAH
jgi:predicted lipoprotein with Yx(FWY)xxD motif